MLMVMGGKNANITTNLSEFKMIIIIIILPIINNYCWLLLFGGDNDNVCYCTADDG